MVDYRIMNNKSASTVISDIVIVYNGKCFIERRKICSFFIERNNIFRIITTFEIGFINKEY